MNLPIRLIKFWYPDALQVFLVSWRNLLNLLEEDLAVGLMLKLLFVPLFHDSSFVGKILSFFFRLNRIIVGLLAFALATVFLSLMASIWFIAPLALIPALFFSKPLVLFCGVFVIFGVSLFIHHLFQKTAKKVWQVQTLDQIWAASTLKKEQLSFQSLLLQLDTQDLLLNLEVKNELFASLNPVLNEQALQETFNSAKKAGAQYITPVYFWLGLLSQAPNLEQLLMQANLQLADFEQALVYLELKRSKWRRYFIWDEEFGIRHLKGVNRGWLSAPTPNLDAVSTDLTKIASTTGYDEFLGRQVVVTQVINILSQTTDRNVLIVGLPGSGRTALVKHLSRLIIAGDAPPALATKRLVELDLTKLISGVTTEGELAQKVKAAFEEVQFIQDVIIYVDELQNLGLGQAATNFNLYSLLLPYLESNRFQFLASTDNQNYARIIEKNGSFARLFHKVELPPASVDETIQIVEEKAVDLARNQKINVTYKAIKELVYYANQLIHDRVLPDSALSQLNECQTLAKNGVLDSATVKQALQTRIKVPILEIDQTQKQLLLNLEEVIHSRMIDQEPAVKAVSDALRRASTSLREKNRPIGSFLFVGPTGVGKTELAKTLAATYFKSTDAFVQFDMSEYQIPEAVTRLIGNSENPGELTEIIKNKPYCLLLLDEFEKANPQIVTLFLQVLEEGRLTDSAGKQVDFTNTIIIATSNAGSLIIAQGLESGKTVEQISPAVKDELLKVYKPELINRFDEVVIFKPLSTSDLQKITQLKLVGLQTQLKEQGYLVEFSPELVQILTQKGYDPVLGARPMRRLIQDSLEANLSKLILEGKLLKGTKFVVNQI